MNDTLPRGPNATGNRQREAFQTLPSGEPQRFPTPTAGRLNGEINPTPNTVGGYINLQTRPRETAHAIVRMSYHVLEGLTTFWSVLTPAKGVIWNPA